MTEQGSNLQQWPAFGGVAPRGPAMDVVITSLPSVEDVVLQEDWHGDFCSYLQAIASMAMSVRDDSCEQATVEVAAGHGGAVLNGVRITRGADVYDQPAIQLRTTASGLPVVAPGVEGLVNVSRRPSIEPDAIVEVPDPDEGDAPPVYSGHAGAAHQYLTPGIYSWLVDDQHGLLFVTEHASEAVHLEHTG